VADHWPPGFNVENRFVALERRVLQSEADAEKVKVDAEKAKVDSEKAKEALERRLLQSEANAEKAKVVAEKAKLDLEKAKVVAEKRSMEDTKRFLALESKLKQKRASAQVTQGSDATKTTLAAKPAPTNAEVRLEELERKLLQSEVNAEKAMEEARSNNLKLSRPS
jgi:hypothetical protein